MSRWRVVISAIALGLPALVQLSLITSWSCWLPEPEAWRVIWLLPPLEFNRHAWMFFQGSEVDWGFRLLHWWLLHLPGVSFPQIPIISWLMALGTALLLLKLLPRISTASWRVGLWLVVGLLVFSPRGGANWLVAERFRVFVPPLCLLVAMVSIHRFGSRPLVLFAIALLVGFATATERVGLALWPALAVSIAATAQRHSWSSLALWFFLANVSYFTTTTSLGGTSLQSLWFGRLAEDPLNLLLVWFERIGATVPGALGPWPDRLIGLTLVVWCGMQARQRGWLTSPHFALLVYVLLAELLLAGVAYPFLVPGGFADQLSAGGFLLVVVFVCRALDQTKWVRWLLFFLLTLGLVQDWVTGVQMMRLEHRALRQAEAISAVNLGPLESSLRNLALIDHLPQEEKREISNFARIPAELARGALQAVDQNGLSGWVAVTEDFVPDLVFVTREADGSPAKIVSMASLSGSIEQQRFALSWSQDFAAGSVWQAYVYDVRQNAVCPLQGVYRFEGTTFECLDDR